MMGIALAAATLLLAACAAPGPPGCSGGWAPLNPEYNGPADRPDVAPVALGA